MYLFVHKDFLGLYILTETSQHYFVYRRNLTVHTRASTWYIIYILLIYCIDAPQRIVIKSLYNTALPFSILNRIIPQQESLVLYNQSVFYAFYSTYLNFIRMRSQRREFQSEIESANLAKRANLSFFIMLCGISCELAGCVHRHCGLRVYDSRLKPNQILISYTLARSAKLSRLSSSL